MLVTYLTPPVATETLRSFYRKVQPGGPGWKRVVAEARAAGDAVDTEEGWDVPIGIVCMILGCLAVWGALFGIGSLLYGQALVATVLLVIAAISTGGIMKLIGRIRMR